MKGLPHQFRKTTLCLAVAASTVLLVGCGAGASNTGSSEVKNTEEQQAQQDAASSQVAK